MQLKQISRILVQFSPYTGQARSAREFLARVTSSPAQKTNPDCQVQARVRWVLSLPSLLLPCLLPVAGVGTSKIQNKG